MSLAESTPVLIFASTRLFEVKRTRLLGHGRPSLRESGLLLSPNGLGSIPGILANDKASDQRSSALEQFVLGLKARGFDSHDHDPLQYIYPLIWLATQQISESISKLRHQSKDLTQIWDQIHIWDQGAHLRRDVSKMRAEALADLEKLTWMVRNLARKYPDGVEERSALLSNVLKYCDIVLRMVSAYVAQLETGYMCKMAANQSMTPRNPSKKPNQSRDCLSLRSYLFHSRMLRLCLV